MTRHVPLLGSETPAEPVNLTIAALPMLPVIQHSEDFSNHMLPLGLSTALSSFMSDVSPLCKTRFRLAELRLYRERVAPSWSR